MTVLLDRVVTILFGLGLFGFFGWGVFLSNWLFGCLLKVGYVFFIVICEQCFCMDGEKGLYAVFLLVSRIVGFVGVFGLVASYVRGMGVLVCSDGLVALFVG